MSVPGGSVPHAPHILVIRRRYLGDIVLLGPVLRNLKLRWPDARIAVLCERHYAGVLELNLDVNEAIHFPQRAGEWWTLLRRLRRARFTHVLDLDNRDKTALLTLATGARHRVTQRHTERLHFPSFYTASEGIPTEFLDGRHITDLYLHPLRRMDVPIVTRECRLVPKPDDLKRAQSFWFNGDSSNASHPIAPHQNAAHAPKMLVHPGSRSPWRVWPPANFATVIERLHHDLGAHIGVVAGPGEQATVNEIFQHLRVPAVRMPSNLSVPQLAALFSTAKIFLCHDSGPMHLAAAVGTRVGALYGSQTLSHWRPLGEGHTTLQPPLPCVNCVSPGRCNPADPYFNHCVRNITPDRVVAAVRKALK